MGVGTKTVGITLSLFLFSSLLFSFFYPLLISLVLSISFSLFIRFFGVNGIIGTPAGTILINYNLII